MLLAMGRDEPSALAGRAIATGSFATVILLLAVFALVSVGVGWKLMSMHCVARPLVHDNELRMSTDSPSPEHTDRPIRPLPRRRLRGRLSHEVAESIQYPPEPKIDVELFCAALSCHDDEPDKGSVAVHERNGFVDSRHVRAQSAALESDEDEEEDRNLKYSTFGPVFDSNRLMRTPRMEYGAQMPGQPLSSTSSVDGYESFENTNNKKKRKSIATGETAPMSVNHSSIGVLSSSKSGQRDSGSYPSYSSSNPHSYNYATGSHNVSGPGRGRYGRIREDRRPLGALSDSINNWAGRTGMLRPSSWTPTTSETSSLFAPVSGEKRLGYGGEHAVQQQPEMLKRQPPAKLNPTTGRFTFTCDSPRNLGWDDANRSVSMPFHVPSVPAYSNGSSQRHVTGQQPPGSATADAQTGHSRPLAGNQNQSSAGNQNQSLAGNQIHSPVAPKQKSRKAELRELDAQARTRRRQQERQNQNHPPKEAAYICYFCEYEWIFGEEPRALIEQYERKERRQRLLEEERKAKLAKKLNSLRKGVKKSSKGQGKINQALQDTRQAHEDDHANHMPSHDEGKGPHGEDNQHLFNGREENQSPDEIPNQIARHSDPVSILSNATHRDTGIRAVT